MQLNGSAAAVSPVTALLHQDITQPQDTADRATKPVKDVYRAICQVAKAISRDGIAKGRQNQQQGYQFRGIDDIYNALSALLAGADLCILPRMTGRTQEERATAKGGVLFYVTVQAEFDFVSSRDGSKHTVGMYGEGMDSADKATNKAMSAAYKYACMQVFCIPTEGMEDGDATTAEPQYKPKAPVNVAGAPFPGTQAQANVAEKKIAELKTQAGPAVEAPWKSMPEVIAAFAAMREQVGEMVWLQELARYGWHNIQEMCKALDSAPIKSKLREKVKADVTECYRHLDAIAKEGK